MKLPLLGLTMVTPSRDQTHGDTHWSKLTRCWHSGRRSTSPSQTPLCPAPNGRCLPEMGKEITWIQQHIQHSSSRHHDSLVWGKRGSQCAPSDSCGTSTAWWGMKYQNNERAFLRKNTCREARNFWSMSTPLYCGKTTVFFPRHYKLHARRLSAARCLWLLTPVIQHSENKPGMEAGWLMLTARGITARKHRELIGRNEGLGNELVACDDMSCSSASESKACPKPNSSLATGTAMETFLSLSISAKSGERIQHCAKLTSLPRVIPHSSLITISTRASKEVLEADSQPRQMSTCKKKGHKHVCVPEGNCALNVLLQPCRKIWPFPKSCNMFGIKKLSKSGTSSLYVLRESLSVFQSARRAQTVEACSSMQLLCCTASWLQMAAVCSGPTEPAAGQMLRSGRDGTTFLQEVEEGPMRGGAEGRDILRCLR